MNYRARDAVVDGEVEAWTYTKHSAPNHQTSFTLEGFQHRADSIQMKRDFFFLFFKFPVVVPAVWVCGGEMESTRGFCFMLSLTIKSVNNVKERAQPC